jgi:hypothetical protein
MAEKNANNVIDEQKYPNGEEHPGYSIAFQIWILLFLIVICFGLINYLALWYRSLRST